MLSEYRGVELEWWERDRESIVGLTHSPLFHSPHRSKFLGRTFEIRPTGVAHVKLKVPTETAPQLPIAQGSDGKRVEEHFSWNKVTTSVSGFIVGSPTIDHVGDMIVTNHASGEKCTLTFKPRGWRGKDAFEIKGAVHDKDGKKSWDIAGRWNSQLVARKCGNGKEELNPDEEINSTGPQVTEAGKEKEGIIDDEYVLLWKNSHKPQTPFVSSEKSRSVTSSFFAFTDSVFFSFLLFSFSLSPPPHSESNSFRHHLKQSNHRSATMVSSN